MPLMNNIFEKIGLTVKLLKILDIYFCYSATNEKIAITNLLNAMELQTVCHLIRYTLYYFYIFVSTVYSFCQ